MDGGIVPELLDLIYGAAVEPERWPGVLRRLGEATSSHGVVMTRQNERTGKGEGIRAEPNPEATRLYYGHFATRNVFLEAEDASRAVRGYRPEVLTDEHKIAKPDLLRTEYYNDFMRVFDIHSVLILRLSVIGLDTVVLNLHRTLRTGAYTEREVQLANVLLPHLVRALGVSQKLTEPRLPADGAAAILDRSQHGFFIVDDTGRVLYANSAGEALLSGDGPLRLASGALTTAAAGTARQLQGAIAAATCDDEALRTGNSLTLRAGEHDGPLAVTVTPCGSAAAPWFQRGRLAMVCATDPTRRLALRLQTVRSLYDLTPAEARIAHLLYEGLPPGVMAKRLNLSIATVRVHLARIFDKTGAHGQVELTRLLMSIAGGAA